MSEREQYGELADQLEDRAGNLAQRNQRLGEDIAGAREDWERKRADAGVPGATPEWDDPDKDDEETEDTGDTEDTEEDDAEADE